MSLIWSWIFNPAIALQPPSQRVIGPIPCFSYQQASNSQLREDKMWTVWSTSKNEGRVSSMAKKKAKQRSWRLPNLAMTSRLGKRLQPVHGQGCGFGFGVEKLLRVVHRDMRNGVEQAERLVLSFGFVKSFNGICAPHMNGRAETTRLLRNDTRHFWNCLHEGASVKFLDSRPGRFGQLQRDVW